MMLTVDINPKDLGTIKIGVPISFKFILTSALFEIVITKITAGCGSCTTANMASSTLPPNTSKDLDITFTPNSLGHNDKRVTLTYTEDGEVKNLAVNFIAAVIN